MLRMAPGVIVRFAIWMLIGGWLISRAASSADTPA